MSYSQYHGDRAVKDGHRSVCRDYIIVPTRVLTWDQCRFGLSEILIVAHAEFLVGVYVTGTQWSATSMLGCVLLMFGWTPRSRALLLRLCEDSVGEVERARATRMNFHRCWAAIESSFGQISGRGIALR